MAADLSWEIGAGFVRKVKGTVIDTSKSGRGLIVAQPFPLGASITIVCGDKTCRGAVKRCIKQGANHLVGVRLEQ